MQSEIQHGKYKLTLPTRWKESLTKGLLDTSVEVEFLFLNRSLAWHNENLRAVNLHQEGTFCKYSTKQEQPPK